jgi:amidohydrolase
MLKQAHAQYEQLIEWRRDFHMHPELGFELHRTAKIVAEEMERLGYRVRRGVGKTGVVAEMGAGHPVIAIRADMDALPILEFDDRPYLSQIAGTMHACGHDSHTAMGMGAATILAQEKFPGTVRFLFQPSEETTDDEGLSGAQRMIDDGAMDGVDMIIAQHVDPSVPVGQITLAAGPVMGGVDSWYATVIGKSAHAAHPHEGVDTFVLAAHVIFGLDHIVSRRLDPFSPAVVSIGAINGGFTENVIPERVEFKGTLRYTTEEVQKQIHAEIQRAFELSLTFGGDYELRFELGSPPMTNHHAAVDLIGEAATHLIGQHNILPPQPTLGAEDFSEFLKHAPGAMFMLGTRIEGDARTLHHPRFDIDERAMPIGAAILAESALRFLRR